MDFKLPHNLGQLPDTAAKQIHNKVKLMQNGQVQETMKKMGIHYTLNYGVPLPLLRNLSKEYKTDHALALKLWSMDIRETYILASLLENPATAGLQQIEEWCKKINNQEMAEQLSRNLFAYLPFAPELIEKWMKEDIWKKIVSFNTAGWMIKFNLSKADTTADLLLSEINESLSINSVLISKSVQFFLHSCASISPAHKSAILSQMKGLMTIENSGLDSMVREFLSLYE